MEGGGIKARRGESWRLLPMGPSPGTVCFSSASPRWSLCVSHTQSGRSRINSFHDRPSLMPLKWHWCHPAYLCPFSVQMTWLLFLKASSCWWVSTAVLCQVSGWVLRARRKRKGENTGENEMVDFPKKAMILKEVVWVLILTSPNT